MNLKQKRKAKGYTQLQVANKVGVSLYTYQLWENGGMKPRKLNRDKLVKVLERED